MTLLILLLFLPSTNLTFFLDQVISTTRSSNRNFSKIYDAAGAPPSGITTASDTSMELIRVFILLAEGQIGLA